MADLNAAGGATFGGLQSAATGRVEAWPVATPVHPDEASTEPTMGPVLTYTLATWDDQPGDVQVQVSQSSSFASMTFDATMNDVPGDGVSTGQVALAGLSDLTTYYWRVRGIYEGRTGPWGATRKFRVNVLAGKGFLYVTENVGAEITRKPTGFLAVMENVGVEITRRPTGFLAVYQNFGVEVTRKPTGFLHAYEGDVNTETPNPHLWFLRPNSGREGDGVQVVGWGFGHLQSDFAGVVEIDYGGDRGWEAVPVVSWQTLPPTPDAYTADRTLNEVSGEIDMQHTRIEITVPAGAVPPGYPIRVRTEGP